MPQSLRVVLNFFKARSGLIDRRGDFNKSTNNERNSSVKAIACCSL